MAGRLKEYRARRKTALARSKTEQTLKKHRRNIHSWCPECSFQLFTASGSKLDFCARCGWERRQ